MKKILAAILLLIPALASGQNVSRGYKLLEKPDFEKAEEIFRESYSSGKNKASSALALAFIYADERSPFFDLVEAWQYANDTKPFLEELTTEEIEIIGEYFLNTETRRSSRPVISKIEYALETIENKLIKFVREENNLDLVYEVLNRFPEFRYYGNVIHIRNYLEFRKSEKENTIRAYNDFVTRFPDAAQVDKARKYIRTLELDDALKINTTEALNNYVIKYPETPEYSVALRALHKTAFTEAVKQNTFEAMEAFVREYPDALETAEAIAIQRKLLYAYARSIKTLEAYNNFILKYPEGEYFVDIFNLKSSDLGAGFMMAKPPQPGKIIWARAFEDQGYEVINAVTSVDKSNNYIIGTTVRKTNDGREDAWIIKESGEGVMIWNSLIAEELDQNIKFIGTDGNNNIVGLGETWPRGADSLKETRLFSISSDGRKLWSRTIEIIEPESFLISGNGNIVIAGYMRADSVSICGVMITDNSGKELILRGYSVSDTIRNILETDNGNLIIAGSSWMSEIDNKGHIIWETSISGLLRPGSLAALPGRTIIYSWTNDKNNVLSLRNISKGTVSEKPFKTSGRLLQLNNNTIALHGSGDEGYILNLFRTSDISVIKSIEFPGLNISDIITDREGRIVSAVVENGRAILIKSEIQY